MLQMFSKREETKAATPAPGKRPAAVNSNAVPHSAASAPLFAMQPPRATARERAKFFDRTPSVGQYLYHLATDLKNFTKAETQNAVVGATPVEVQRLSRILAKLKGRYLAYALDLGAVKHGPVTEVDIQNLERARFMYEELERAVNMVRSSIEAGDLTLEGLQKD